LPKKGEVVDVAVIGGGPGGYTAAERAAQLDGRVILIEKDRLGGNCLNRGCIPVVTLMKTAQILSLARTAKQFGVVVDEVSLDYEILTKRKDELVGNLVAGTERRLTSTGVEVIKGTASLGVPKLIKILKDNGQSENVTARNVIVATGSSPLESAIPNSGRRRLIMAEEALALKRLPRSMTVIGCDYIGVQLACLFNRLGTSVSVVEAGPRLLPEVDEEISMVLQELLMAYGISVITEAKVTAIADGMNGERRLTLAAKGETRDIHVEEIVLSRGRKSNTEGLGLEKVGVAMKNSGGIVVDEHMRTNVPGIYAVGDVVGRFMLAQVAMAEGNIAAENAMGRDSEIDYKVVPRCIFTLPEVATVGLTERQAIEQGYKVKVARLPMELNAYAHIMGQTEGLIKIVADAQFGEILGMHIVGPQASDLIHEAALGMKLEATIEDVAKTIRVHPSLAEAIRDATWKLYGWGF